MKRCQAKPQVARISYHGFELFSPLYSDVTEGVKTTRNYIFIIQFFSVSGNIVIAREVASLRKEIRDNNVYLFCKI